MIDEEVRRFLIPRLFNAAVKGGAAIMGVYHEKGGCEVTIKSDKTPLTEADRLAHKTIRDALGITRIPILSEEGREMRFEERANWELYWLVDPLDGTAEFIKGNHEFTVNIALMENKICIWSVVYVPYFGKMYFAERGRGAFLKEGVTADAEAEYSYEEVFSGLQQLPFAKEARHEHLRVGVSRSYRNADTDRVIDFLRGLHPDLELVAQGSSYKFCLLAEGRIDYYPRTSPTYEWDTAAGELILAESGGRTDILTADGIGGKLRYNEECLENPWFVARSGYCPEIRKE